MASFVYNRAAKLIADGGLDLLSETIKVLLVGGGYTPDRDHDFVDAGGANDVVDHELNGTGYTGGYAGSGRRTLGSKTITEDDTNDRGVFDAADPSSWTGMNAGTIAAIVVFRNGSADDTTSLLIAYLDPSDLVTNGSDVALIFAALGILHFSTV